MADAQKDTRTVFVRGINFDVDEKPLEELFSNIGPVKQCFLVRQKGEAKHKGVGFVTFALPEDAQRAIDELHGSALGGRKLLVEHANKRASFEERKRKRVESANAAAKVDADEPEPAPAAKPAPAKPARTQAKVLNAIKATSDNQGSAQAKHKHMCTVAVGGLTAEAVPAALKLANQAGKVQEVIQPAPADVVDKAHLKGDGCSGLVVLVVYSSVQDAMNAVTKLHGKKISPKGDASVGNKKKRKLENGSGAADGDAADVPCVVWARQLAGEGAHVRKWRVIVRNLAFKVSEAALRNTFSAAGFVWELTVPKSPDGRAKGFAFVGYTLRAHAQKAIEQINNKEIAGRPVSVDWAVSKAQYEAAAGKGGAAGGPPSEDDDDVDGPEKEDEEQEGDLQLSSDDSDLEGDDDDDDSDGGEGEEEEGGQMKGKVSKKQAAEDDDGYALDSDDDDEDMEEGSDEDEDDDEDDEGEESDVDPESREEQQRLHNVMASLIGDDQEDEEGEQEEGGAEGAEEEEEEEEEQGEQGKGKGKPGAESQKEAGDGKPAVADAQGVSRTVFVRGLPLDTTKVALQAKMESYGRVKACRLVIDKTTQKLKGTAFVEYMTETGAKAAADACARGRQSKGPGVVFSGKTIDVDLALTADDARKVSETKAGGKLPKDKRNLYLAKEGEIKPGSAAWNSMSEHDRDKRGRCADEKRTKLKSPNFIISPVRLSIRNIPFSMNEARLRSLAVKAVKERANQEKPEVTQVKILRDDTGKVGPDGKPKSKGMGFIEFSDHAHAVACLRQMNNNPEVFTRDKRPIVEFAIDNVKVLKKLEAIQARRAAGTQQGSKQAGGEGSKAGGAAGGRGGDDEAAGDAEGGEADLASLTPRQRKKLKAKAKMQRRKLRKQQAEDAGQGEGGEGGQAAGGQQSEPAPAKPKAKAAKQAGKDRSGKQQQAAGGKQDQRKVGKQKGPAAVEGANGKAGKPQDRAQQSKRRREDEQIDQVANAALLDSYSGLGKRQRRGKDEEKQDKLDKLAEQYKRKLAGDKAPARKPQARTAQGAKPGQKRSQNGGKPGAPVALDFKVDSIKRWFE